MRIILFTMFFVLGFATNTSAQDSLKNRPTDVRVTFANSSTYKGTYTGHAVARFCGQTDPLYFGKKTFGFEYPLDLPPGDPIEDVTFYSDELVDGVKKTTGFHVSVNVNAPAMGHPAAWAVDTLNPAHKATGEATLSVTGTEIVLSVKATNSLGEKLELAVTCHPPKR